MVRGFDDKNGSSKCTFSLLVDTIPASGDARTQSASMNGVSSLSNETKFQK